MRKYEYKQNGSSATGRNPMIPNYRIELGTDADGKNWLCEISPTGQLRHLMWNVDFDTDEEYWVRKDSEWWTDDNDPEEYSSPFLRPEVVYAKEGKWAEMHRTRYHRKTVEYCDIAKAVDAFVESHGIK